MAEEKSGSSNFRVLIADDDTATSRRCMDFLKERGFGAMHASSGTETKELVRTWKPHFILCDLTLQGLTAPSLLAWIKTSDEIKEKPKVFVTSGHNIVANIKECIRAGATDYVVKPYKPEDILTRLVFHIQNKREIAGESKASAVKLEGADIFLNLLDVVMRETLAGRTTEETLFNMSKMVAITLSAVRCSVVMVADDLQSGRVMASSDDRTAKGILLDMNKYPEMLHVVNTEKAVVIEDLEYDPQLAQIKHLVKGISFNSMIICPIRQGNGMYGVMSARMDKTHSKFNERDIRFVGLVAQIISLFLAGRTVKPHEVLAA